MPMVDMKDMLTHAYRNAYAVGGFDLVSLDFLEAIVAAAEQTRSPVILSLAESHFEYYDFELVMAAVETAAQRASVPIAIHLDHGASHASAVRAIRYGCNGVMVDASHEIFTGNVALTRNVVEMAHACGIAVEGELGYVAGVEGEDAQKHPGETIYTSIEEAELYVQRTGVDFLAVSIGTVHGRMRGKPRLDFERLKRINETLHVPLVIHGGTGLSDDQFRRLIGNGVSKINYYTALADTAAARIRSDARNDRTCGYTGLTKGIRDAIRSEVERCMVLWGSAGRAAEVLAQCGLWQPIHHVIVYNAAESSASEVAAIMARGHGVLSEIPGVRRVVTGWSAQETSRFRYCWLIEFAHRKVIDSYRDHPDHVAFANDVFRPVANERISLDFIAMGTTRQQTYDKFDFEAQASRRMA
ncbi:MAG: ketose-bisphosphate aldolase [Gammaproteobacteria bacterium]|nr:ketose-bisphosphate aldolase [Gammaproteobacteria bacterium]